MDCLASSTDPDMVELRRGLARSAAKAEDRPRGRCRKGDMLVLPVDFAVVPLALFGGLISSLTAIVVDSLRSRSFNSGSTKSFLEDGDVGHGSTSVPCWRAC